MPKRPKKSTLNNALDRLASLQARERANHRCEVCGGPANQVHHYVGRDSRRVRWSMCNLTSICPGCHLWAENSLIGLRGGHTRFESWFATHRPEDHAYLNVWENIRPINRSIADLIALRDEMKAELEELRERMREAA